MTEEVTYDHKLEFAMDEDELSLLSIINELAKQQNNELKIMLKNGKEITGILEDVAFNAKEQFIVLLISRKEIRTLVFKLMKEQKQKVVCYHRVIILVSEIALIETSAYEKTIGEPYWVDSY